MRNPHLCTEFIRKGQSQLARTELDFLNARSTRERQDRAAGASAWIAAPPGQGHGEMAKHTGLQLVAQHRLASFSSSLRSLQDRHLRLSSPFDSSSSTQGGVMRHRSPGWQHLLSQRRDSCSHSHQHGLSLRGWGSDKPPASH